MRQKILELEDRLLGVEAENEGLKVKLKRAETRADKYRRMYEQIKDQQVLGTIFEGVGR